MRILKSFSFIFPRDGDILKKIVVCYGTCFNYSLFISVMDESKYGRDFLITLIDSDEDFQLNQKIYVIIISHIKKRKKKKKKKFWQNIFVFRQNHEVKMHWHNKRITKHIFLSFLPFSTYILPDSIHFSLSHTECVLGVTNVFQVFFLNT